MKGARCLMGAGMIAAGSLAYDSGINHIPVENNPVASLIEYVDPALDIGALALLTIGGFRAAGTLNQKLPKGIQGLPEAAAFTTGIAAVNAVGAYVPAEGFGSLGGVVDTMASQGKYVIGQVANASLDAPAVMAAYAGAAAGAGKCMYNVARSAMATEKQA